VLQIRRRLDFDQEPLGADDGGEFWPEHLQRDFAGVLQILGQVDGGHAALAELALKAIAAGEGDREAGPGVRHIRNMESNGGQRECGECQSMG